MALTPGTRLGSYEITAPIGKGGMGEVYRATDTRLRRDVAIKVLPADFTQDRERLARFEREARTLASLNHRNIATLHGFETQDAIQFLVMELVEGETLADRIARGAIPVDEALPLFLQIAEGLEAAHEKGVVHRDLKPANIKITGDGGVKILDFGLAKAVGPEGADPREPDVSLSPTLTLAATQRGEILGTAAYMSPEQAKGKPVDRRTDIWAFGACLLEALSGKRAFKGADASELMASILMMEPQWDALPATTPDRVRRLLRRCLQRNVTERLQHIGDARLEIGDALNSPPEEVTGGADVPPPGSRGRTMLWGLGGLLLGAAVSAIVISSFMGSGPVTTPRPVTRFSITLPREAQIDGLAWPALHVAISQDGSRVVFDSETSKSLYLRSVDDLAIVKLEGTDGARNPFFSPDGEYVAYFTREGDLKKIHAGGKAQALTIARGIPNGQWAFGSWGDNNMIVFSTWSGGLSIVPADGGTPQPLTRPEGVADQDPRILPGSEAVLFFRQEAEFSAIKVLSLAETGSAPRTLIDNASHPRYLASGHLLFVRDGGVLAARFDPVRLEIIGSPRALPIELKFDMFGVSDPVPQMAVSRTGTLVYAPAQGTWTRQSDLVWVDRDGKVEPIGSIPVGLPHLQLSPDNTQLALEYRDGPVVKVSIYDMIDHAIDTQLAQKKQEYPGMAIWMPDGKSILFSHPGAQEGEVVMKQVAEGSREVPLFRARGSYLMPRSVSADGNLLAYHVFPPGARGDIGVFRFGGQSDGEQRSFLDTPQSEYNPALSPDGQWIAYCRDGEVYISRYPSGEEVRRVSFDRGDAPLWSRDGKELFYQRAFDDSESGKTELWARSVATTSGLDLGESRKLFEGWFLFSDDGGHSYDVSRDGKRFLMVRMDESFQRISELTFVQNWFVELERLVPAD